MRIQRGRFDGSVAVVTGAGSGIGLATARLLVDQGATLVAVDWRPERTLADLTRNGESAPNSAIVVLGADVTEESDVGRCFDDAFSRFGHIDVLVNCAGIVEGDDIASIERASWDRNIASVLTSVYLCTRKALALMVPAHRGSIVNIASVNGLGAFGDDAYSAAKAGVMNLTKSVAVRYGSVGIRCNAVAPADIRTPRWAPRLHDDPELLDRLARWYPLGRIGEPEDVARAALFLASDEASWITGTTLVVDGGLLAGNRAMMSEMYPLPPGGDRPSSG